MLYYILNAAKTTLSKCTYYIYSLQNTQRSIVLLIVHTVVNSMYHMPAVTLHCC